MLLPNELQAADGAWLDLLVRRHVFALALGSGVLRDAPLAAALLCDWFAVVEGGTLLLEGAEVAGGLAARMGAEAYRLHLLEAGALPAARAVALGLADALVPATANPLEWISEWRGARSDRAMQSAAMLLRNRGGDALERAEFARLFASGEPQIGLRAFLGKRVPQFE